MSTACGASIFLFELFKKKTTQLWLPLNVALHPGSVLVTPDIPEGIARA